jgi:undecaprenyl-diphosphatase
MVFALALEASVYRTTTLAVHRDRPAVHRLEHLPVNASYFSGHTAAAIAVYCGIALLLTSRIANRGARVAIWATAAAIPVFVALARMYRGMHHPIDVAGGVVVGIAVLVALVFLSRAAGHAAAARGGD